MAENLLIVESPAKAKTLKKYLGKRFDVLASYGHVRDLIPKEGAVEPDQDFAMHYQAIEKNKPHADKIFSALKKAKALYLATDPDREGEAIAWHLVQMAKERGALKDKEVKRVVFHEITKGAIQAAVAEPRDLAQDLVNAQQARRALDYLVGFKLSPLLWRKIRRGLSAGRVQSPALRMIVEREIEIESFKTEEYWTIHANCDASGQEMQAKLSLYAGEKVKQFTFRNEASVTEAKNALLALTNGELTVLKIEKKQRKRNPAPPFTTSTLQQEASRKLGFSAQKTMRVAQQLYEGIELGGSGVGLITYMRTDSVSLAKEAVQEIREVIADYYGADKVPKEPRVYKTKAKNAQEAHEAIRPTSTVWLPSEIRHALSPDQFKLYNLIWQRAVASQMIPATINTVSADMVGDADNQFRATGSSIHDPGFMLVYSEGVDDSKDKQQDEKFLPPLEEGQKISLSEIQTLQHFTEPPPRYSEASLVKALEEHGIGRPSTYAAIISTLQAREYVVLEKKRFFPTDVGRIVNKFLTSYFTQYVDYDFTAKLEDDLDAVSRGEKSWVPLLKAFWDPFAALIRETEENVQRKDVTQEALDEQCPKCSAVLSIRLGKRGRFVGCSGYPDCDYTRSLEDDSDDQAVVEGRKCPTCESELKVRHGRYGKFIGCSGYPKCRYMEPFEKPKDTGVQCPKCKQGNILERKSRRGKIFYSCERYPDCEYALWNEPLNEPCPKCDWPIVTLKTTKKKGAVKLCPQADCDFSKAVELEDETSE